MSRAVAPATPEKSTPAEAAAEPGHEGPGAGPIPNPRPPTGDEDGTRPVGQLCADFVTGP
jgi:hypothetical protein